MLNYWKRVFEAHNILYTKEDLDDMANNQELEYSIYNYKLNPTKLYSGGGKVAHIYDNRQIIFFKTSDEYSTIYSLKENNKESEMDCILIIIEKELNQAVISNISAYPKCIDAKINKLNGHRLLDIAIDFIKSLKRRYNLKRIRLTDNSTKGCSTGNKIKLSKLYILTNGHTWYGSRGFYPIDKRNDHNEYNKILKNKYNENIIKFNKTKIKHVKNKFLEYLIRYSKTIKDKNEYDRLIKEINKYNKLMNENQDILFGNFVKYYLENLNSNCQIFASFYEELFNYIQYNDFHTISFEMLI